MILVRGSRIQISKIVFYWAIFTFVFSFLWTLSLQTLQLVGVGPAFSLVVPALLGAVASVLLYMLRDRQALEYNDEGYRITRRNKDLDVHKWSEFKECSVIKDSYGRKKVRAYVERDGNHRDIDPSACGIDPFVFREFMRARISYHGDSGQVLPDLDVFGGLEKEIQRGRTTWVADLNETFRGFQISGEVFPLIARGNTRPKGFLLSRFVAVTIMPNYEVCLYADVVKNSAGEAKSAIMRLVRIIETQRDEKNIKWSWLLLFSSEEPSELVTRFVQDFGNKDVGIGCIDVGTGKIVTSRNQLGRSLANQMRLNKLMADLRKKQRMAE
jgi:hypothetical protein